MTESMIERCEAKLAAARREVKESAREMRDLEGFIKRTEHSGEDVRLARWARERWEDRIIGLSCLEAELKELRTKEKEEAKAKRKRR